MEHVLRLKLYEHMQTVLYVLKVDDETSKLPCQQQYKKILPATKLPKKSFLIVTYQLTNSMQ